MKLNKKLLLEHASHIGIAFDDDVGLDDIMIEIVYHYFNKGKIKFARKCTNCGEMIPRVRKCFYCGTYVNFATIVKKRVHKSIDWTALVALIDKTLGNNEVVIVQRNVNYVNYRISGVKIFSIHKSSRAYTIKIYVTGVEPDEYYSPITDEMRERSTYGNLQGVYKPIEIEDAVVVIDEIIKKAKSGRVHRRLRNEIDE